MKGKHGLVLVVKQTLCGKDDSNVFANYIAHLSRIFIQLQIF